MSAEASRRLRLIALMYARGNCPCPTTWLFHAGETNAALEELAAAGLVMKMLGTTKGFAWRLTDEGHARVLALCT